MPGGVEEEGGDGAEGGVGDAGVDFGGLEQSQSLASSKIDRAGVCEIEKWMFDQ